MPRASPAVKRRAAPHRSYQRQTVGRSRTRRGRSPELGAGLAPPFNAIFAPPTADAGDILVGNQRRMAAISAAEGAMRRR